MRMRYFLFCLFLMLIVSCSSAPKNQPVDNDQPAAPPVVVAEPFDIVEPEPELAEPVLAEADEEEEPQPEYIENLSMLDEPEEIAIEPEAPPVAMETLRPARPSPPPAPPPKVTPSPPKEPPPKETPPKEAPTPKTPPQTLQERRAEQAVPPPLRESWKQPLPAAPEIAQEPPPADDPPQAVEEERVPPRPDNPITFSRVARVTVGQIVEIPFRGRDWVFLGEVGSRRGIAYDSRKTDTEGDSFIFRVDAPGVYALKFYRQDFAQDIILNDHVQVIADAAPQTTGLAWFNPPTERSRVIAGPRWPSFLEQPLVPPPPVPQPPVAAPPVTVQPPVVSQPPITPPTTVQPPAAARPPATTQPPATVRPPAPPAPATAQPPATVQPPVVAQPPAAPPVAAQPPAAPSAAPPASRPSVANEAARPQAPSGPQVIPSGDAIVQNSPEQAPGAPPSQTPPQTAELVNPDSLLKQARDEFNAGRVASALTLLDQFRSYFPSGSDEAWWLYGQCYEANSPNRNMLSALDYYRRLVREYPQSSRLSEARRRISYLERYYINIQ